MKKRKEEPENYLAIGTKGKDKKIVLVSYDQKTKKAFYLDDRGRTTVILVNKFKFIRWATNEDISKYQDTHI